MGNPQGNEAVTITQFGRVELDPNKVPMPAPAPRDSEPSFRERLDTVTQERTRERVPEAEAPVDQDYEPAAENDAEPTRGARDTRQTETAEREPAERPQPLASRAPAEPSARHSTCCENQVKRKDDSGR